MTRPLCSLVLYVLLAGCSGDSELRSSACDEGQPVVASGRVVLDESVSEADVSSVRVELIVVGRSAQPSLGEVSSGGAVDFPLAFTLCADLSGVAQGEQLAVIAEAEREVEAVSAWGAVPVSREQGGDAQLEVLVSVNGCYCGPACDPTCAF